MSIQKILMIDNDTSVSTAVQMTLSDKYDIATTTSAMSAFKFLAGKKVDLILLDINMPKINGIEALREIKKMDHEIDVIMISAYASVEHIHEARTLGAYGFIVKPFDVHDLRKYVDSFFSQKVDNE